MNARDLATDMSLNPEHTARLLDVEARAAGLSMPDIEKLQAEARKAGGRLAGATLVLLDNILDARVAAANPPKETP